MDIQSLLDEAVDTMLTDGHIMPMLYLELEKDYIVIALDVLSDAQSIPTQCGILARLGWEEMRKHPGQKVAAVYFTSEAWKVTSPPDLESVIRPVRSTKREEVLILHSWEAGRQLPYHSWEREIRRDHKKRVVDVGPVRGPWAVVSPQIRSFLHGCQTNDEVMARMEKIVRDTIPTLSPEKKQALAAFLREEGYTMGELG